MVAWLKAADRARGTLVSVERLEAHSALKLRIAQRAARIPKRFPKRFPVHHGVVLHRVTYWTELGGQPQLATGLLGVPRRHRARTSVMWLNGTNPTRSEAPSAGGLVGLLVGAVFAGSGHLLLAPDYIGLGTSDVYHPYMHTASTVDASTDFVRAVASYCEREGIEWCPALMLVQGYLAGGSSWFRSALEENEAVGWAPSAPLRLYYGDADVDVHPDDALLGAREMRERVSGHRRDAAGAAQSG